MKKSSVINALPIVAAHYGEKFGVKVIIGQDAYTDGETITVPNVSEDYPNKDVIWGYLAHEAGHVRSTDFSKFGEVSRQPLKKHILNILEDSRVESEMFSDFPGCRRDLDSLVRYMSDTGMFSPVSAEDHPASVMTGTMLFWLRTHHLMQPTDDLLKQSQQVLEAVFPIGVCTRLEVLLRKNSKCKSTGDCLVLAESIYSMLEDESEKEPPEDSEDDQSEQDSGGEDDDSHDPQGSDGSDSGDAYDEGGDSSDQDAYGDQPSEVGSSGAENQKFQNLKAALAAGDEDCGEDAFEALREELSENACNQGDPNYCTVPVAPDMHNDASAGGYLLDEVLSTTSKVRSQLQGLVQASRRSKEVARRSGKKLCGKKLSRVVVGDMRVFSTKNPRVKANTAIHILVDLSGSMSGGSDVIAKQAALAVGLALEGIKGVNPAVTFFGGYAGDPVRAAVRHGKSVRQAAGAFAGGFGGGTPMAEALWYAAFELSKCPEARKIIIPITDGSPDNPAACTTVINLCDKALIEFAAIGIRYNVSHLFSNCIVINGVDELRTTLFGLVRDKLTVEVAA